MDVRYCTAEDIFKDYMGRYNGFLKALTTESDELYQQCDPDGKEEVCLYGYPDGSWKVVEKQVYPKTLQPMPGINFAKKGMTKNEWLTYVAIYSESWMTGNALYYAIKINLDTPNRVRLFDMMAGTKPLCRFVEEEAKKELVESLREDVNRKLQL